MIFITDTGGGNALNVQRTVRDIIGTGAAGLFLEVRTTTPALTYIK